MLFYFQGCELKREDFKGSKVIKHQSLTLYWIKNYVTSTSRKSFKGRNYLWSLCLLFLCLFTIWWSWYNKIHYKILKLLKFVLIILYVFMLQWLVVRYSIYNLEVINAAIKIAKQEGLLISLDLASFEVSSFPLYRTYLYLSVATKIYTFC